MSKKSTKGQNGSEKKGNLRLRSRSASGANKNYSWLTRTFKKAFNSHGDSEADAVFEDAAASEAASTTQSKSQSLKSKGRNKKFVIPQVQVTPTNNGSSVETEEAGGRKMDSISGMSIAGTSVEKKKKKFAVVKNKWSS